MIRMAYSREAAKGVSSWIRTYKDASQFRLKYFFAKIPQSSNLALAVTVYLTHSLLMPNQLVIAPVLRTLPIMEVPNANPSRGSTHLCEESTSTGFQKGSQNVGHILGREISIRPGKT